jgi:GNAT superfamily N-acetyltransferase
LICEHNGYEIDDDRSRMDFAVVHGWLTTSYWSPGISREMVERGAENSTMLVGAYWEGVQVGYMRVVSDTIRFAYICDVFVDDAHRGRGVAKAMVNFALMHPLFKGMPRWLLSTRDAHDVYANVGFSPLSEPERWMIRSAPSENS